MLICCILWRLRTKRKIKNKGTPKDKGAPHGNVSEKSIGNFQVQGQRKEQLRKVNKDAFLRMRATIGVF